LEIAKNIKLKNHYTDIELLQFYTDNGSLGFQRLVVQFQERVYWQIRRLTKNHQDTEDVMQNVFIKVWKALPNFKGDSALFTWIYRITFNETHTFLTKRNKTKSVDLDPPIFENKLIVEGHSYTGDEMEAVMFKAIESLPEKQQHVFRLKYLDDLKYKDIAKLLDMSEGGLKANYHHAVKKIEAFIKQY
jgi:RNA polymerase sigma-70 factor (ECF subfamily)